MRGKPQKPIATAASARRTFRARMAEPPKDRSVDNEPQPGVRQPGAMQTPQLEPVFDLTATVSPPIDVGDTPQGRRRLIPILEGKVTGTLQGRILPGGADAQLISTATLTTMQARYVIETDQRELVYVENTGMRVATPEVMARLNRGEVVDPSLIYFRSAPRFETASPRLAWLMTSLFVASGARFPDRVELRVFRVT